MATNKRYGMLEYISANTNYNITAFEEYTDEMLFRMCERIKNCLRKYPEQIYNTCKCYNIICEPLDELKKLNYNVLSDMLKRLKTQTGGVIVKDARSLVPTPIDTLTGAYVAKKEEEPNEEIISDPQYLAREELPRDLRDLSQEELLNHGIITDQDSQTEEKDLCQEEYYETIYYLSDKKLCAYGEQLDFMTLLTLSVDTIKKFKQFLLTYDLDPSYEDGIKSISSFYQGAVTVEEDIEQLTLYECGLVPAESKTYGREEDLENQLFNELLAAKISINGKKITKKYLNNVPYITLSKLYELVLSLNDDLNKKEIKRLTKK